MPKLSRFHTWVEDEAKANVKITTTMGLYTITILPLLITTNISLAGLRYLSAELEYITRHIERSHTNTKLKWYMPRHTNIAWDQPALMLVSVGWCLSLPRLSLITDDDTALEYIYRQYTRIDLRWVELRASSRLFDEFRPTTRRFENFYFQQ